MKRTICALAFSTLLLPGSIYGASKEQEEMQRDIAQLQDQVRTLQSGFDQSMAKMQTLLEQALDAGNRTNTTVSVLNQSVKDTLDRELKDALQPVANLAAKLDNLTNDSADTKNSLADLTTQINRLSQKIDDLSNAVKVLQAPAAPPPPAAGTNPDAFGAPTNTSVKPPAGVMYSNAMGDYAGGKPDLAAGEFAAFVRDYPDDQNAPQAQIYIGQIHMSQMKYSQAVMDFDAVEESYPDSKAVVDAYFLKGMSLKSLGQKTAAAEQFKTVMRKYPHSDRAPEAKQQLIAMGLSPSVAAKKRRPVEQ